MKQLTLIMVIVLGSSFAMAELKKTEKPSFRAEFNEMIQENQKSAEQLRHQLQEKAGIRFDDKPGTIAKENLEIPSGPEEVVVSSSSKALQWKERKDRAAKDLHKADMKRISQELKEASH